MINIHLEYGGDNIDESCCASEVEMVSVGLRHGAYFRDVVHSNVKQCRFIPYAKPIHQMHYEH